MYRRSIIHHIIHKKGTRFKILYGESIIRPKLLFDRNDYLCESLIWPKLLFDRKYYSSETIICPKVLFVRKYYLSESSETIFRPKVIFIKNWSKFIIFRINIT